MQPAVFSKHRNLVRTPIDVSIIVLEIRINSRLLACRLNPLFVIWEANGS